MMAEGTSGFVDGIGLVAGIEADTCVWSVCGAGPARFPEYPVEEGDGEHRDGEGADAGSVGQEEWVTVDSPSVGDICYAFDRRRSEWQKVRVVGILPGLYAGQWAFQVEWFGVDEVQSGGCA